MINGSTCEELLIGVKCDFKLERTHEDTLQGFGNITQVMYRLPAQHAFLALVKIYCQPTVSD